MALCEKNLQCQLTEGKKVKKKNIFNMQLSNENKATSTLCWGNLKTQRLSFMLRPSLHDTDLAFQKRFSNLRNLKRRAFCFCGREHFEKAAF